MIVRTSGETIGAVVKHEKHALNTRPHLSPGEIILVALRKNEALAKHQKPIQYLMEFDSSYSDEEESLKLFGKRWPYIIKSRSCRRLKTPFDICEHQVSTKGYGPGGTIVYVLNDDIKVLKEKGLLETM